MTWFSRSRGESGRLEPRIVESAELLRDDDEIVIRHGIRRYRLRASRSGRLKMSRGWPAIELTWLAWVALPFVLVAGHLAGAPVVCAFVFKYVPSWSLLLQFVYAPAQYVYDRVELYEGYCDWLMGLVDY